MLGSALGLPAKPSYADQSFFTLAVSFGLKFQGLYKTQLQ